MKTARKHLWNVAACLVIVTMLFSATFVFSAAPVFAQQDPPPDTEVGEMTLDEPSDAEVGQAEPETEALVARAQQEGAVGVIVVLKAADAPDKGPDEAVYATAQDAFTRSMAGYNLQHVYAYKSFPLLAMKADASAIQAMLKNPLVEAIQEDKMNFPTLADSTDIVGAIESADAGVSGADVTVVILDTGVQNNHPFLSGKIVQEACFSGLGGSDGNGTSLCPGGTTTYTQYGTGAAAPTACASAGLSGCDHGTHVAGIAAGKGTSFSGVAKDANIIAINVFTRYWYNGAYRLLTFDSDYIKAMDHVYSLRMAYDIASVNMSLGGGGYTKYCDGVNKATKKAIDKLRGANIATIIASGNNGYTNAISSPGCISTAISVGSTTKSDTVSDFSNSASFLKLLAPGSDIYSSVTGSGYGYKDGTSMATPHVTGAWAVLRQAFPTKNVSSILALLKSTGVPVRDGRNKITRPRINVAYAIAKYRKPDTIPTLSEPVNGANLTDSTPEFRWFRLPLVTKYKLVIKKNGVSTVFSKLYPANTVCSPGDTICSVHIPTILKTGTFTWTIQPYSGAGGGPVSAAWTFYTPVVVPGEVGLDYPLGGIGIYSPDFKWYDKGAPTAARYTLRVYNYKNARILNRTYDAFKVCNEGECQVPKPLTLKEGDYRWEILPWNPVGYGPTETGNFNYHHSHGYGTHFNYNKMGFTTLYPKPTWWWLGSSTLYTFYGANYTYASGRVDTTYGGGTIDMTARMYRDGDPYSANSISVFGVPTLRSGSKEWKTSYDFIYANDGSYSVWKTYNHADYALQGWTYTDAIIQDDYNTLRGIVVGDQLSFYINGTLVWSGTDNTGTPLLSKGSAGVQSYVQDWWDYYDYLYIDSINISVPDLALSDTVSAEQQALNEAANANPSGSKYGPRVSAEMAERMQNAPGKVESILQDKMQACLAAGNRCALPFPH